MGSLEERNKRVNDGIGISRMDGNRIAQDSFKESVLNIPQNPAMGIKITPEFIEQLKKNAKEQREIRRDKIAIVMMFLTALAITISLFKMVENKN